MDSCCKTETKKKGSFFTGKTFWTVTALALLLAVSFYFPRLVPFRENVLKYFKDIWWAVLLGFFLGGLLERYVPREYISLLLAKKKKRTILYAVMMGFLMSACSHGILALSIQLHKKGASTPVIVSFLLASPWANLPVTLMLLVFFGWKALYIIVSALVIALSSGILFQFLERRGLIETNKHTVDVAKGYSVLKDVKKRMREYRFTPKGATRDAQAVLRGSWALTEMVLPWILIGIALSGLVASFIPPELFQKYMGPTFLGLLATLGLATVMEVCSEGTAPLAFEIYKQTGAFGNAFVFLMAGVVTDLTEISLVWANIGRKTAIWIPLVAVPQVVALGILANKLF